MKRLFSYCCVVALLGVTVLACKPSPTPQQEPIPSKATPGAIASPAAGGGAAAAPAAVASPAPSPVQ